MRADRSNQKLNEEIEAFVYAWEGTIYGQMVQNMYENGSDYESICAVANIEYEE